MTGGSTNHVNFFFSYIENRKLKTYTTTTVVYIYKTLLQKDNIYVYLF